MTGEQRYPGLLIAFEGPDVGLRRQALEAIRNGLESRGRQVLVSHWMGSALAGSVYDRSASLFELSPRTLTLLVACDLAERMEWEILPALEDGLIVLADRYVHRVALGSVRDVEPDWLEVLCSAGPIPDAIVRFPVSASDLVQRFSATDVDLYEAGMDLGLTHDLPLSYRFYQERLSEASDDWAVRHGLKILDLASVSDALEWAEDFLSLQSARPDPRRASVLSAVEESGQPTLHPRRVATLALQLFDCLQKLHGLGPAERSLLEYACLLHDTETSRLGEEHPIRAARRLRERHALDLSTAEIETIAVLIAIHRVAEEQGEVEEWYTSLSPQYQRDVNLLGPLFRLADGLDVSRAGMVRDLSGSIHDGLFDLVLNARGKVKVEIRMAVQRADLFEQAYDLHLAIKVNRRGPPPAGADLVAPGARPWHERE